MAEALGAVETMEGLLVAGNLRSVDRLDGLDELVLRVRGGDVEAFNSLMAETQSLVLGIAWRFLGDAEQAKDACQEAYMRAFRSLGTYKVGGSFTAWIGRIAANVCCDTLKTHRDVATDPQLLESVPAEDGHLLEAPILQEQQRDLVQKALGTLTRAERVALVLRDVQGLTTDETARMLGLKPGTVRTQIVSARSKVKDYCQAILHRNDGHKGGRP